MLPHMQRLRYGSDVTNYSLPRCFCPPNFTTLMPTLWQQRQPQFLEKGVVFIECDFPFLLQ